MSLSGPDPRIEAGRFRLTGRSPLGMLNPFTLLVILEENTPAETMADRARRRNGHPPVLRRSCQCIHRSCGMFVAVTRVRIFRPRGQECNKRWPPTPAPLPIAGEAIKHPCLNSKGHTSRHKASDRRFAEPRHGGTTTVPLDASQLRRRAALQAPVWRAAGGAAGGTLTRGGRDGAVRHATTPDCALAMTRGLRKRWVYRSDLADPAVVNELPAKSTR